MACVHRAPCRARQRGDRSGYRRAQPEAQFTVPSHRSPDRRVVFSRLPAPGSRTTDPDTVPRRHRDRDRHRAKAGARSGAFVSGGAACARASRIAAPAWLRSRAVRRRRTHAPNRSATAPAGRASCRSDRAIMIPLLLFLLALAAVYVGTIETAFTALMRLSLRLMAERGGRDDRLGFYLEDPTQLFIPARLLLGLIFSLATMFIAILTGRTGFQSIGMLLVFVAIFILVFEHVLPLLIVRRNPERVLEVLLPPFDVAARFLHPLTGSLVRLVAAVPRRERPDANGTNGEPLEVQPGENAHAEDAEAQGIIEGDERRLLQSIVDFGDTLVREVMTPRPDMVAIQAESTFDEVRALFREQEYSRIPVYNENLDNIVGFVFIKDLIRLDPPESGATPLLPDLTRFIRPATFVPETKRVAEMLKEFQRQQVQIAIVVDEYGGTAGLVTIEDLLEEIVGEIRDEYDVETEPVVDEGDGSFVFSAKVNIDEVKDRLGIDIEPEGFETVGGYVLTRAGRVPAVGETFETDGLQVEVLEAERRRIHKVRMRLVPQAQPEA